jgi:type IV pilus assembly protein PilC
MEALTTERKPKIKSSAFSLGSYGVVHERDARASWDTQSQAFKKHPKLFDNKLIAMIQVAEQTNQDELVYENLKQHYNNLLQQQAKTFTNFINPILTLIVGFIVGFILIALYLPMFKMSTLIN